MKLIKIINGVYGFRPQPYVVELKDASDQPFEVSDEEAARLVDLGVAAIAFGEDSKSLQDAIEDVVDQLEDQPVPPEDPKDDEPEEPGEDPDEAADPKPEPVEKLDPEELAKLTNPQLAEIAKSLGVTIKTHIKKSELIALIIEAQAEDDALPDLGAADPEV